MRKRILGLLTALVLCLGLLPGLALAEEADELDPEVEYSLDGGSTWIECDQLVNVFFQSGYSSAQNPKVRLKRDIVYNAYSAIYLAFGNQSAEIDGQGHTIRRGPGWSGQIFEIGQTNSTVTMKNIIIDGGAVWNGEDPATRTNSGLSLDATSNLVYIHEGSKLILGDGAVLQNNDTAYIGGAVLVNDGTLTMEAGSKILNNSANGGGGGVCVYKGTLSIEGGEISGNAVLANNVGGGGIFLTANSSCTMSSGEISGNYAGENGGGVIVQGTCELTGGTVSRNSITGTKGGGVLLNNGSLTVGGALTVSDNTAKNDAANNIYLPAGKTITAGSLASGAQMGVTTATAPTDGTPAPVTSNAADSKYFFSDDLRYVASNADSGVVQLALRKPSTVTFEAGDGVEAPEAQETNEYGKLDTIYELTRDGYTFDGWFTEADGGTKITVHTVFDEDTTVYAHWLENHTVTFISDGVETGTQAVADGRTAVKPADPAKSGYLFGGWFKEETCENEWDFETDTITEDLTLYAKWTPAPPPPPPPPPAPKTYTVRFLDGDAELSSLTVQAGDKAAPPDEPEKEGFRFAGWHTDREGTAPFDFETAVTADLTLYAKWSPVPTPDPEPTPPPAPSQPSGSGSSSSRDDDDDDDEPRSPASTTTTTTRNPDGTTTSVTTDRTTGKVTTVTKTPEGVSVTVTQDKNGDVTSVRAEVPARKDGTVRLPVEAEPGAQVDVRVQGGGTAAVELPVRGVTPGTVAVTASPDGTVIRKTLLTGNGVAVTVRGSASVRLEDRGRTFADVPAGGWKAEAAAFVSARELFNGTGPNTFNPDGPMTRAMLAAVLHNLEGNPAPEGSGGFLDVSPDAWCADAVSWAAIQRIVDGYAGGLFRPGAPITREQLAVMLWRYAGCPAPSPEAVLDFPDADAAGDYAREALLWAVEKGILSGYGDGRLDPKGTATRVQAAQMLRNFMTR